MMMEGEVWLSPWYNAMVADVTAKHKARVIQMDTEDLVSLFDEMLAMAINFDWEEKRYTHEEIKKIMGIEDE